MSNISVENRIKQVRQTVGLNQIEFGLKLGVSVGVISNIELHRNKTNIANNPICSLICSIFNVNSDWLLMGEGEMFMSSNDNLIQSIQKEYNLSDDACEVIKRFLNLPANDRDVFLEKARKIFISND